MKTMERVVGQAIRIQPDFELDPATPVGELFVDGAIQLVLMQAQGGTARFAVYADSRLRVMPDELIGGEQADAGRQAITRKPVPAGG